PSGSNPGDIWRAGGQCPNLVTTVRGPQGYRLIIQVDSHGGMWNKYCSFEGWPIGLHRAGATKSMKLEYALLSENDISSILNLICPNCGGPLGRPSREFMCQGHCRKDWGPDW